MSGAKKDPLEGMSKPLREALGDIDCLPPGAEHIPDFAARLDATYQAALYKHGQPDADGEPDFLQAMIRLEARNLMEEMGVLPYPEPVPLNIEPGKDEDSRWLKKLAEARRRRTESRDDGDGEGGDGAAADDTGETPEEFAKREEAEAKEMADDVIKRVMKAHVDTKKPYGELLMEEPLFQWLDEAGWVEKEGGDARQPEEVHRALALDELPAGALAPRVAHV